MVLVKMFALCLIGVGTFLVFSERGHSFAVEVSVRAQFCEESECDVWEVSNALVSFVGGKLHSSVHAIRAITSTGEIYNYGDAAGQHASEESVPSAQPSIAVAVGAEEHDVNGTKSTLASVTAKVEAEAVEDFPLWTRDEIIAAVANVTAGENTPETRDALMKEIVRNESFCLSVRQSVAHLPGFDKPVSEWDALTVCVYLELLQVPELQETLHKYEVDGKVLVNLNATTLTDSYNVTDTRLRYLLLAGVRDVDPLHMKERETFTMVLCYMTAISGALYSLLSCYKCCFV